MSFVIDVWHSFDAYAAKMASTAAASVANGDVPAVAAAAMAAAGNCNDASSAVQWLTCAMNAAPPIAAYVAAGQTSNRCVSADDHRLDDNDDEDDDNDDEDDDNDDDGDWGRAAKRANAGAANAA
jgi:hypothetical protein